MNDLVLRRDLLRLAHEKPALRTKILAVLRSAKQTKDAGSLTLPLFGKTDVLVTAKQIKATMAKAGFLTDFFDFTKIQFDTVDPATSPPAPYRHGFEAIWRVFGHGEFGDRNTEYVWGTVQIYMASSDKGIQVAAIIRVKV